MPHRRLTFPLRGFGPGAQAAVDRALTGLAGVLSARADEAAFQLHIEYDDTRVAREEIHDALARAGIAHAPHGSHADSDTGRDPSAG